MTETRPRRFRIGWEGGLFLLILLLAVGMRLWELDGRAIHYDESLHLHYSYRLAQGQGYSHSPMMHGPFQFHVNALVFYLFWDSDYTARLAYALFGAALVALPYFLRGYLGRAGALVTSAMLALSPTLLYFSRFARNDIYMAFWALALVVLAWRYIQEGRNRYLYLASAVLALALATKETAFLLIAVLGAILFLLALPELVPWILGRIRVSQLTGAAAFLILMITLTLPQWSPLASILQDWFGIVLVNADEAQGIVGLPLDNGVSVALGLVALALAISVYTGVSWKGRVWLACGAIFYAIWVTLYTTFYTNLGGFFTGMWQSMGYWLAQHEVARGGQPWYYYLVIGSTYEFFPILFSLAGLAYYLWKGELLGLFLVFWAVLTFVGYTLAGEKMPWLVVNVALPCIVLAGKFIGNLIGGVPWRRALSRVHIALLVLAPLLVALGVWLLDRYLERGLVSGQSWTLLGVVIVVGLATVYLAYRARREGGPALAALGLAGLLLGFSFFVGARASYSYDDSPVEMLTYAQGSIDVRRVADSVRQAVNRGESGEQVAVDYELWYPYQWYARNDKFVNFHCYKDQSEDGWVSWCSPLKENPSATAVLLNTPHARRDSQYLQNYAESGPHHNLLWFPEVYRGLTLGRIKDNITRREAWKGVLDYYLKRRLGSPWWFSDFYAYLPR